MVLDLFLCFRNIFLGETFSSYISIHNDSKQTCKEILVKVCLIAMQDIIHLYRNLGDCKSKISLTSFDYIQFYT